MLCRGPVDSPEVFLTFDDGPDPEWTPRVLDVLARAQARATFFLVGRSVRAHPVLARRILDAGHEIGNHTLTHAHPWMISAEAGRREVRDGAAAIEEATGRRCAWFRPPHGRLRRCMVEQAADHGQTVVLWSRSAVDWGPLGSNAGVARRLQATRAGDILLMHDAARGPNRPWATCAGLATLLALLAQRGLKTAPLASLQQSPPVQAREVIRRA